MKKLDSTLKNMFLSMLVICSAMAFALGSVYSVTKDAIEIASKEKETKAVGLVLPTFDNQPVDEKFTFENLDFYPAKLNGQLVGMAVKTFSDKGFSGKIVLMVGISSEGKISNIVVMEQKETPGLGTKMTEPRFKSQFFGKGAGNFKLSVKKDGGDVDAITAATISSRAFCDGINKAFEAYKKYNQQINKN